MPISDFKDLSYLKNGNPRQLEVYNVMMELQLMEKLREFDPILVGTIPIEIDLPDSDLDVICCVSEFDLFKGAINERLDVIHNFKFSYFTKAGSESLVVQFTHREWLFELFAQAVPTVMQNGYKHMVVEQRILGVLGEEGRQRIIDLKRSGLKTEPAFARLLGLNGDPFHQLLLLADWSDERLRSFMLNENRGDVLDE